MVTAARTPLSPLVCVLAALQFTYVCWAAGARSTGALYQPEIAKRPSFGGVLVPENTLHYTS